MSSGLNFPGGNNDGNEDDFQSPPTLTMGGQKGSPSMMNNPLMSDMMGQNNLEIDITRIGDQKIDSGDVRSGNEQINNSVSIHRKKRNHRHTQYQIRELENSFKSCPHPDDKQRKTLSRDLGLEPLQVKFWFQNKRTQMKMQHERHENSQLQSENERLLAENIRLRTTVGNAVCTACGGPTAIGDQSFDEYYLRMENLRLKGEINRMSEKCIGKQRPWATKFGTFENRAGSQLLAPGQLVRQMVRPTLEVEKQVIAEVACVAMNELIVMTQIVEPMWISVLVDRNTIYMLNEDEYFHGFLRAPTPRRPGFRWEATRDSTIVMMNTINFIGILMNVNQWASLFCGIVAKAIPLELLSAGASGSYDGALQLLNAEFQMLSPLVPTREAYMARFCKKQCEGIWAVVDFSLDGLNANPMMKFQKRPSGCLVQQLQNGYSKITWIEHAEVEDRGYNVMYMPMIISGAAFGATHWLSVLNWQCERFSCCNAIMELPPNNVNNFQGKKCMLKLADRMVIGFCSKVGASSVNPWTTLSRSGNDEIKVMTHQSINEQGGGGTSGIAISVATSIWLPVVPKKVFDFFCDENHRAKWDVLTKGANIIKIGHITTGEQPGNGIVLLQVNATPENPNNMLILQESYVYRTGCFIVFAPIDLEGMNKILDGGDSNEIAMYPSGFAILPDGSGSGGSLVTLAFQILVDYVTDPTLSLSDMAIVNGLMTGTMERVRRFFERESFRNSICRRCAEEWRP